MNALVAGSGSYIERLSVRDLHGPTVIMSSLTVTQRAIGAVVGGIIADAAGKLNYCKIVDKWTNPSLSPTGACLIS